QVEPIADLPLSFVDAEELLDGPVIAENASTIVTVADDSQQFSAGGDSSANSSQTITNGAETSSDGWFGLSAGQTAAVLGGVILGGVAINAIANSMDDGDDNDGAAANRTPTAVALSNTTVDENAAGAIIGDLSTTDPDANDTHTYTVSDDRFEVTAENKLKLKDGVSLDHETEATVTVTVTSKDSGGLTKAEDFTITVTDVNDDPTAVALDNMAVAENATGAVIGKLTTTDQDAADTHTYTVSDERFEVDAENQLKLKADQTLDYEAEATVAVTVTSKDSGDLTKAEDFTITVTDVNDAPTAVALDNMVVAENATGAVIGKLTTTDQDATDTHIYTVSDERFEVDAENQLKLKADQTLDYETEATVDVTVTATDPAGLTKNQLFTVTVNDVQETTVLVGTNEADTINRTGGLDDFIINSHAGDDTIITSSGNDIVRPGPGVDDVNAGAGDDIIVAVGTTTADQYEQTDIDAPAGNADLNVSSVLTLDELNNNTTSEVVAGESIDGGEGNNTLLVYGDVDVTGVTLSNITTIQVNSSLTIPAQQLQQLTNLTAIIGNGTSSVLNITGDGSDQTVDFSTIEFSNFYEMDLGAGVTLNANQDDVTTLQILSGEGTIQPADVGTLDLTGLSLVASEINVYRRETDHSVGGDRTKGGTNRPPTDIDLSNMDVDENAAGAIIGKLTTTDRDIDTFRGDVHAYTRSSN
ncbi:hypothetical protein TI03_03650, partial [Achromatium sp. WMS1]